MKNILSLEFLSSDYYILITTILVFAVPYFYKIFFFHLDDNFYVPAIKTNGDKKEENRFAFFDFARGISILAVILIHVTFICSKLDDSPWYKLLDLFSNNISRFTIGIFFITSGLLLSPSSFYKTKKKFYLDKIIRVYIPYLICCMIFLYSKNLKEFFHSTISGNFQLPYYFIIDLAQLYLLYPLLLKIIKRKFFLPCMLLTSVLFQLLKETHYIYEIPTFPKYLFFFAFGMFLRRQLKSFDLKNAPLPQWQDRNRWVWIFFILMHFYVSATMDERFYNTHYTYSVAIFYLLISYFKDVSSKNILARIGQKSLWIFLLHYFFVKEFAYFLYNEKIIFNAYLFFFTTLICSTLLSIIAAFISDFLYQKIQNLLIRLSAKLY